MPWKLTVRIGPKVERERHDTLDAALDSAAGRVRELSAAAPKPAVELKVRRFDPAQQVSARIELSGPERFMSSVRGGIDVRGDGSTEAYVGRVRRELVEPKRGETPVEALRRALRDA
jgi:hypothetical protein